MAIKIKVEKIVNKDGIKTVLLEINNMRNVTTLPEDYVNNPGSVWLTGQSLYVHTDNQERQDQYRNTYPKNKTCIAEYLINYDLSPDLAEYLIRKIQEGGERLHTINQRIERERAMYAGVSEIVI